MLVEILAIALAIVAIAGAVTCLVLMSQRNQARLDLVSADNGIAEAKAANDAMSLQAQKYEQLIASYKAEVSELEKDLASCSDPAAIRERLQRLLSSGGSGEAAGSVPAVTTSHS